MIELHLLALSLMASVLGVVFAALFLLVPETARAKIIPYLINYAIGILLAAACLRLLPKSFALLPSAAPAMATFLAGLFCFAALEKTMIWRHCYKEDCRVHSATAAMLNIGNSFHDFMDGVVIGSTYLVSPALAFSTTIAIIAHEIPKDTGNFAVLLASGWNRKKAFFVSAAISLSNLPGAFLAYYALDSFKPALPYVMAFSASSFVYIALADLVPFTNHKKECGNPLLELLFALGGVATILFVNISQH